MQLNRTTDYALRLLHYLGCEKRIVPSSEMSRNLRISKRYLLSIAKDLKDYGYLKVYMGPGGGFSLAKPPKEISLYDIIAQMEGTIIISPCHQAEDQNTEEPCILHEAYSFLQSILECYLRSLTIDMLVEQPYDDWQSIVMEGLVEKHYKDGKTNIRQPKCNNDCRCYGVNICAVAK